MSSFFTGGLFGGKRFTLIVLGLLLNSVILSAGITFLISFRGFSSNYFGGANDVVVVYNPAASTIFTGSVPEYLAGHLKSIKGVLATSGEILTPVLTLSGEEVTSRGVTESFFEMQELTYVEGSPSELSDGKCLLGQRTSERLGLKVGDYVTFRSLVRDSLVDCYITGVFTSGSSLEDEVVIPMRYARLLGGAPSGRVTVLRVKLDMELISEAGLRKLLEQTYSVSINVNSVTGSEWNTDLDVRTFDGSHVLSTKLRVPGTTSISLPYGHYIFEVDGQTRDVLLDTNSSISFDLDSKLNKVSLHVVNSLDGEPIPETRILIIDANENRYHSETDIDGKSVFYLNDGEYSVSFETDSYTLKKKMNVKDSEALMVSLGPSNLRVVLLDGGTGQPVAGVSVAVIGEALRYENNTDATGGAYFILDRAVYNITVSSKGFQSSREVNLTGSTTLVFLTGLDPNPNEFKIDVSWSNETIVSGASVSLRCGDLSFIGISDGFGTVNFIGLPSRRYSVTADSEGFRRTIEKDFDGSDYVKLILPTPVNFRQDELGIQWIRYLPNDLAVKISGRVFGDSMKLLVDLVESTLIVLAGVFTFATTVNSVDVIRNSITENRKTLGLFRAIGATWRRTTLALSVSLIIVSLLVGVFGYILGYLILWLTAKSGFLIIAGYLIQPRFNLGILLGCTFLCPIVSIIGLISGMFDVKAVSIMTLMKGLRRSEILHLPEGIIYPFISLIIPLLLRAVPEFLAWPLPLGWDTVSSYIPVWVGLREGFETQLIEVVRQRPLFWVVSMLPYPLSRVSPFKVFPIILHGLLGLSIYYYGNEFFGDRRKALAASLLSTAYFISLRVSWDLHANEMGLILVFTCLTLLTKGLDNWFKTVLTLLAVLSTTLTHEGASILLFVSAVPILVRSLKDRQSYRPFRVMVVLLLPLFYFVYHLVNINYPLFSNPMNNFQYPSGTYDELVRSVLTFYLYCTMILLPFILVGRNKDQFYHPLLCWFIANSLAALSPIISPLSAFNNWERWTYLTVFPLSFFVIEGLAWLSKISVQLNIVKPRTLRLHLPVGLSYFALISLISVGFVSMPPSPTQPFQRVFGSGSSWLVRTVPSTMVMSTVTPADAQNAVELLEWFNENVTGKAVLMVDEEFRGYAWLLCDTNNVAVKDLGGPYYVDPSYKEKVVSTGVSLLKDGFDVYFLGRPMDLMGFQVLRRSSFVRLYHVGSSSI